MLRDEMNAISTSRSKLRDKLTEVEDELRRTRDQIKQQCKRTRFNVFCAKNKNPLSFDSDTTAAGSDQEEDGNVSLAQRKRFTRVEMARVLMERNQVCGTRLAS